MLEPTKQILLAGRVILASGSPRRKEIIENLGLKPEIIPSNYDENLDRADYKSHGDFVQDLSYFKVLEVYNRLNNIKNDKEGDRNVIEPAQLIIGSDTIVTMNETIYGKPKDEADAVRILSILAGKTHTVYTGVCLKPKNKDFIKFYEKTDVKFGDLSKDQIETYVKTGEPLDKAGGYGIQGFGGCLVERINGDFFTVMGLPLYQLTKHLNDLYN